ncbi:serine-O-acetyltransferase cys2 [Lecanosticta acicola]|uniref:Serine-O-acetyltransferase cys2 n=1 Tax=Lecanosticta acicola TaxID=111012 RepID=A0AAI8YUA0_9PEZI|nr:serine-O-acetyltransferase cys2 [Lecanosticta acicola]
MSASRALTSLSRAAPRTLRKTNLRTRFAVQPQRGISSNTNRPAQAYAQKPIEDDTPAGSSLSNPQLSLPCLDKAEDRTRRLTNQRSKSSSETALSQQQLAFPCLDNIEDRTRRLNKKRSQSGPEPSYTAGATELYHSPEPFLLDWGGVLPSFDIAWEAWGTLNADKSNAILLHTGLSASSHARSTEANPKPGWWEKFIGPGAPLDTNKYFVICTNVLGGCYGSTGPSSIDPLSGNHYGTSFPILTMSDMVRAQFRLLDSMGIEKLYASVGCSMGGMQSLAAGIIDTKRVGRIVSVSGCARSHPYSIAMRHTQRQVLMNDPNWSKTRGNYYESIPPHTGMKLARQIATITYRSGPEWEKRFGRQRADASKPPALCPDFLIETYLDHAGEKWCLEYDANSLLYVSKAMDLFDLGAELQQSTAERRQSNAAKLQGAFLDQASQDRCTLSLPDVPYEEQDASSEDLMESSAASTSDSSKPNLGEQGPPEDLVNGLMPLRDIPTLVLGVASDILFPAWQQREIAEALRKVGNRSVTHYELGEDRSLFGHDTFLLDLEGVGGEIKRFLG